MGGAEDGVKEGEEREEEEEGEGGEARHASLGLGWGETERVFEKRVGGRRVGDEEWEEGRKGKFLSPWKKRKEEEMAQDGEAEGEKEFP